MRTFAKAEARPKPATSTFGAPMRSVERLKQHAPFVQAKLAVGDVDTPAEREADRAAEAVLRGDSASPTVSAPAIARVAVGGGGGAPVGGEARVPTSGGISLPESVRQELEPRFGCDFSRVRVHADGRAAESASALDARAYTAGRNIVFAQNEYAPFSSEGRKLLAHELAHVVQQGQAATSQPGAVQRKCNACSDEEPTLVQRKPARKHKRHPKKKRNDRARKARKATPHKMGPSKRPGGLRAGIVEDHQHPGAGQMSRGVFLSTLQTALLIACDAELAQFGRSAHNCPYILKTIAHYSRAPLAKLVAVMRRFGGTPLGSDAVTMIHGIVARARLVARRLGASPRVHGIAERSDGALARHDPISVRGQLGSGGALEGGVRNRMERSFGTGFGDVRVHTDAAAARLSRELGARAFTVGRDIAFAGGHYAPGTPGGDSLIAHELAHTVQQGRSQQSTADGKPDRALERDADRAASAALFGREELASALPHTQPGLRIQRDPASDTAAVLLAGALIFGEGTADVAATDAVITISVDATADAALTDVAVDAPAAIVDATAADAPAAVVDATAADAPAAVDAVNATQAATDATAASQASTVSTAAKLATAAGALTTLSGDEPDDDTDEQECPEWAPPGSKPILWPMPSWLALGHKDPGATSGKYDIPGPPLMSTPWTVPNPIFKVGSPAQRDTSIIRDYRAKWNKGSGLQDSDIRIHHKWPLFLDGPDVTDNLVILSQAEHVAWHSALYNQSWGYMLSDKPNPKPYCIVGVKDI